MAVSPPPVKPRQRRPVQAPKRREQPRSTTRLYALAAGLGLALVLALVAVSLLGGGADESSTRASAPGTVRGAAETTALLSGIAQDGNALGAADAPVTLVEYADLQCPYCADWARDAFPAIVEEYVRDGRVRIEFRGLAFIGPESRVALDTVLSAGQQDKLWNVLHLLYANQGHENAGWVTDGLLRRVGGSVAGLDVERMLERRTSAEVERERVAAQQSASLVGIESTPSFLAGPTGGTLEPLVVSSLGPEDIRARLDQLLAG